MERIDYIKKESASCILRLIRFYSFYQSTDLDYTFKKVDSDHTASSSSIRIQLFILNGQFLKKICFFHSNQKRENASLKYM